MLHSLKDDCENHKWFGVINLMLRSLLLNMWLTMCVIRCLLSSKKESHNCFCNNQKHLILTYFPWAAIRKYSGTAKVFKWRGSEHGVASAGGEVPGSLWKDSFPCPLGNTKNGDVQRDSTQCILCMVCIALYSLCETWLSPSDLRKESSMFSVSFEVWVLPSGHPFSVLLGTFW